MQYKIEYLPTFLHEFESSIRYITEKLMNPIAAERLADKTFSTVEKYSFYPLVLKPCAYSEILETSYYRIIVDNYSVFYTVNGNIMEIRHFMSNRRNYIELI